MKSMTGGNGVVYFSTAAKPGFNIERSVSFTIIDRCGEHLHIDDDDAKVLNDPS
ncbi:MAG: hypothetical protein JNK76_05845 [Planctomycetales bacterium]|nr:hypothetical protein [Planctomycetales bacterium]MBN8629047.1 hypothetical protein [Planctomycetota bacterium]